MDGGDGLSLVYENYGGSQQKMEAFGGSGGDWKRLVEVTAKRIGILALKAGGYLGFVLQSI